MILLSVRESQSSRAQISPLPVLSLKLPSLGCPDGSVGKGKVLLSTGGGEVRKTRLRLHTQTCRVAEAAITSTDSPTSLQRRPARGGSGLNCVGGWEVEARSVGVPAKQMFG